MKKLNSLFVLTLVLFSFMLHGQGTIYNNGTPLSDYYHYGHTNLNASINGGNLYFVNESINSIQIRISRSLRCSNGNVSMDELSYHYDSPNGDGLHFNLNQANQWITPSGSASPTLDPQDTPWLNIQFTGDGTESHFKTTYYVLDELAMNVIDSINIDFQFGSAQCDLSVLNNEELLNELEIYPNPSNELVNINTNTLTNVKGKVVDIKGKMIIDHFDLNNCIYQLNTSELQNGLYFLILNVGNSSTLRKKLIIKH